MGTESQYNSYIKVTGCLSVRPPPFKKNPFFIYFLIIKLKVEGSLFSSLTTLD